RVDDRVRTTDHDLLPSMVSCRAPPSPSSTSRAPVSLASQTEYHCVDRARCGPETRSPDSTMKRYLIAMRWWAMTRARGRARMWAFLLGPHFEAPPSDRRRKLRFSTRSVYVALAVAGACHLAVGLLFRIGFGAWTAEEARAKHVRTV